MNRTVIILGFFSLIGVGLVGSIVLLLFRPEASAQFISQITLVLGLAVSAAVTIAGLDKVAKNTNGRMTQLIEVMRELALSRDAPPHVIEKIEQAAEAFKKESR